MTQSNTDSQLLPHERLVAYRVAVALRRLVVELFRGADHGLRDQARRSSRSILLNVAEGAGRTTRPDRRRCFEIARGEALEVSAAMDDLVIEHADKVDDLALGRARTLVHREVRLLSGLVRVNRDSRG